MLVQVQQWKPNDSVAKWQGSWPQPSDRRFKSCQSLQHAFVAQTEEQQVEALCVGSPKLPGGTIRRYTISSTDRASVHRRRKVASSNLAQRTILCFASSNTGYRPWWRRRCGEIRSKATVGKLFPFRLMVGHRPLTPTTLVQPRQRKPKKSAATLRLISFYRSIEYAFPFSSVELPFTT